MFLEEVAAASLPMTINDKGLCEYPIRQAPTRRRQRVLVRPVRHTRVRATGFAVSCASVPSQENGFQRFHDPGTSPCSAMHGFSAADAGHGHPCLCCRGSGIACPLGRHREVLLRMPQHHRLGRWCGLRHHVLRHAGARRQGVGIRGAQAARRLHAAAGRQVASRPADRQRPDRLPRNAARCRAGEARTGPRAAAPPEPARIRQRRARSARLRRRRGALLPPDERKEGFDNDAAHLQVSPSYLDQYLSAARNVAQQAVGDPKAQPVSTTYGQLADMVIALAAEGLAGSGSQLIYKEGMPFGTRGGISFLHDFPAAGEYALTIGDLASGRADSAHGVQQHRGRAARWQGVLPHHRRWRTGPEGHRPDAGKGGRGHQRAAARYPLPGAGRPASHRGHLPEAREHRERGTLSGGSTRRRRRATGLPQRAADPRSAEDTLGFSGSPSRAEDLHLPAAAASRRNGLRAADHQHAGAARLPSSGDGCTGAAADGLL